MKLQRKKRVIETRLDLEDKRLLQMQVTGKSVYKSKNAVYLRRPKHKAHSLYF